MRSPEAESHGCRALRFHQQDIISCRTKGKTIGYLGNATQLALIKTFVVCGTEEYLRNDGTFTHPALPWTYPNHQCHPTQHHQQHVPPPQVMSLASGACFPGLPLFGYSRASSHTHSLC